MHNDIRRLHQRRPSRFLADGGVVRGKKPAYVLREFLDGLQVPVIFAVGACAFRAQMKLGVMLCDRETA